MFKRNFLLILLLILIRFLFFIPLLSNENAILEAVSDGKEYYELAKNLALSFNYEREGKFDTKRPPLFPFLLSLFYFIYPKPYIGFIFYLILSIIFLLLIKKYCPKEIFYPFAFLFILSPQINFYSLFPITDLLFGIFLFLAYLFFKNNKTSLSLIFFSSLPYIKPVGLLLPPFLAAYYFVKKSFKKALLFILIPYLSILPWSFLTYKKINLFTFSTLPYINFFSYYLPVAKSLKEKISYERAKELMNEDLEKNLKENYTEKDYWQTIKEISLKEFKKATFHFFISHFIFSFNTLISPISFKPLLIYLNKKIERPIQQEIFASFLKGRVIESINIFLKERLFKIGLFGNFLLVYSFIFLLFILIQFVKIIRREKPLLELLIIFPLIFSTGVVGEARYRLLFEVIIYFLIVKSFKKD
ncbi:MAG: hypothetical protein N2323_05540 [candidate division WOR-3 bacterium]|nr:hypothetical protein [candidate division WOR-3 bacterium]